MSTNNNNHTDINLSGLIGRLNDPWKSYALLLRIDRSMAVWLLFFPAAYALVLANQISTQTRLQYAIIFLLGSWVMRSAGCVANDLWDRDIDARVERTKNRPLANHSLSLTQGLLALFVLLLIALSLLYFLPITALKLAPVALLLAILYPLAKRFTPCPQLVMGFAFGFSAPFAYICATNSIDPTGLWLYTSIILWQTGYDTVYAFQDMEDDMSIGINSLSIIVHKFPKLFLGTIYVSSITCLLMACLKAGYSRLELLPLIPGISLMYYQVIKLDINNHKLCLSLFKSNALVGALMTAGLLLKVLFR